MSSDSQSPSFSHKLRSSVGCFRSDQSELLGDAPAKSPRSPCSWLKSTANELPDLLDRCRNLVARIGRGRRRYHNSADFSYDSYSYALNFEDENREDCEFPLRDFTARLPESQPARVPAVKHVGSQGGIAIATCS